MSLTRRLLQYKLANTTGHCKALYWGKRGVPNNVQVLLIKTVRRHEAGQLTRDCG